MRVYLDAGESGRQDAAEAFSRAAFARFGRVESVTPARIAIQGAAGAYTVTVDGGDVMQFQTEPVLGGDGKTPVGHTNTKNMAGTLYQGLGVRCEYKVGERSFSIEKGRNACFNDRMDSRGKI